MDSLSPEFRFWLSVALIAFGCVCSLGQICRSAWRNKGYSDFTIRMYMVYLALPVVATLALAGAVPESAVAALLGAIIGYSLGKKAEEEGKCDNKR